MNRKPCTRWIVPLALLVVAVAAVSFADWRSGIGWTEPPLVTPGEKPWDPPSDAVVLFDGTDMAAWDKDTWTVRDGMLICNPGKGDIRTKQKFGSVQLHLEYCIPEDIRGKGQDRGNSGVFFSDTYEVQIMDSYENETYFDGQCGSIYKQRAPLVNACKKPGQWQTLDVYYMRPELKKEKGGPLEIVRPGYITVVHNGVLVIYNHEIEGTTFWHAAPEYQHHDTISPIRIQDHGNTMRFRNIWVREIPDTNAKPPRVREPYKA